MRLLANRADLRDGAGQHARARHGLEPLSLTVAHAARATELPLHHRDPFDRMLIAQAQVERLTIVTRDDAFSAYDVSVLAF